LAPPAPSDLDPPTPLDSYQTLVWARTASPPKKSAVLKMLRSEQIAKLVMVLPICGDEERPTHQRSPLASPGGVARRRKGLAHLKPAALVSDVEKVIKGEDFGESQGEDEEREGREAEPASEDAGNGREGHKRAQDLEQEEHSL